jgi:hypothetical protein
MDRADSEPSFYWQDRSGEILSRPADEVVSGALHIWCAVRGDRTGGSYRNVRESRCAPWAMSTASGGRDFALDEHDLVQIAVFDLLFTPDVNGRVEVPAGGQEKSPLRCG